MSVSDEAREGVTDRYIIKGGIEGFDRLKVLSRVMQAVTSALFDRVGVLPGMRCLDVGCGSGDVSFALARRVGAGGEVVGVDLDEVKLQLARRDPEAARSPWVAFRHADVNTWSETAAFDLVYARFLLTHLGDPAAMVAKLAAVLKPGGTIVVEDIDFSGYFCHPASESHRRYVELYSRTAEDRGVDPNIGPRLPGLLAGAGLKRVGLQIVQPIDLTGETKLIPALTMKAIGDAVVGAGHASRDEVAAIVTDLAAMAADPSTLLGMPRVVQAWGRRAD